MKSNRYCVFGFCLETDYRFRTPMTAALPEAETDLLFTCRLVAHSYSTPTNDCLYLSPAKNRYGESALQVFALKFGFILHFPRIADFILRSGEITCELFDPKLNCMIEICLLGHVMSYYLEASGVAALHAGAVAIGDRAVLFVADRTGGKSTLVASMVQAGFPLIADDIAALESINGTVVCRHGFPQLKLTPEQALRFAGRANGFPLVHPDFSKLSVPASEVGSVAAASLPVSCVYLLERRTDGYDGDDSAPRIQIEPVLTGDALTQLVRHSFLANIVERRGALSDFSCGDGRSGRGGEEWHISRFHRLAKMAQGVSVKRLYYPSGYKKLPQVHAAILEDVKRSS